jgi:LysM repeat protein
MRIKINPLWLVAMLLATLTLAACVRPYPQPETMTAPEPDPALIATSPAVQPEQTLPTPVEESLPVATPVPVQPTLESEPTAEPVQDQIHTVQAGDTLFNIASQYGVTIDAIVAANDIPNINNLEIGQQLLIPAPGSEVSTSPEEEVAGETPAPTPTESSLAPDGTHTVQAGENLYRIGLRYGCSVEQMAAANGITNVSHISIGQVLQVPDCN